MATTPSDAVTAAKCFSCLPVGQLMAILAYYSGINAGANMSNPATVLETAKCFLCLTEAQNMAIVAYYLSNGSGGGQFVTYTSGAPANPSNTALPAIAYDPTGALPTLGWNTSTLTWT